MAEHPGDRGHHPRDPVYPSARPPPGGPHTPGSPAHRAPPVAGTTAHDKGPRTPASRITSKACGASPLRYASTHARHRSVTDPPAPSSRVRPRPRHGPCGQLHAAHPQEAMSTKERRRRSTQEAPSITCPRCARTFERAVGLGIHQSRPGPCHDPQAARQRARDREARYRARDPERRRRQMREARSRLLERRPDYFVAWRKAHPESERVRRRRWRAAHPEALREQRRRRTERRRVDTTPLPPSHADHPLFERAWAVLHRLGVRRDDHLAVIHDARWEDTCSEVVLALLEGRDAEAAARETLAAERRFGAVHLPILEADGLADRAA